MPSNKTKMPPQGAVGSLAQHPQTRAPLACLVLGLLPLLLLQVLSNPTGLAEASSFGQQPASGFGANKELSNIHESIRNQAATATGAAPMQIDDDDDDDDEVWYDAEDEIGYDEDAEENACATSNLQGCGSCCRYQGFDLPHWDTSIGQCFCFVSTGDQNVCKSPEGSTTTGGSCNECCVRNHYEQSYFSPQSSTCYCSSPRFEFYPLAR